MARVGKHNKITRCQIESSKDGIITISVPVSSKSYKQGDRVIVTTTTKRPSALMKRRIVSEIVAQGPIKNVSVGKIVVDTTKSPIVSKTAQELAISKKHPVMIKALE